MLSNLWKLFLVFFKIGLFSFGGGLAMVPLFITEFEKHGWMTRHEFFNVLSLAQMTPGAIAMNSSTYVGNHVAGVIGGIIATFSLAAPSVIIMLFMSRFLIKVKHHPAKIAIFKGLNPATIGLIAYAGIQIAHTTFFKNDYSVIHWKALVIFAAIFILQFMIKKVNPIFMIILAAGAGILLGS
ncbi:chromate transporter [Robertkochia solimangrovi]|uniref:chromate transporter n=1 Tax=Robertkochia solimangrovi TaxID=2213046 RepID=UPI00117C493D|nr:chromate transporter [Robertkochia solimangrovi]TRZ41584.1 chromate transporter [Robertkochia solimangrovi]